MSKPSTMISFTLPLLMRAALCVLLALSVASCGFSLRGSQALPDSLTTVVINAPLQYSPISRALQDRLPVYQLNSVTYIERQQASLPLDANSAVEVMLQPEQFERRLLSVFTTGQVAEYELVYTVRYQVTFPNAAPITNTLSVSREYQDDPDQVLAKSRELDLVLSDLRRDAADRIIRLLSSQYASSISANTTPIAQKVN
ncbi:MAG: LPS assembly lipoprotein LptE [Glaciecola sp.]